LAGPQALSEAQTLPRIAETFPVDALDKLVAKGVQGQTFMLDAGSLRGMKLQVRRVMDDGEPGFELMFKVHPSKLEGLLETMKKNEAKDCALVFRGAEVGEDGIAKFTSASGQISNSGTHAPSDMDTNASKWVLKADGTKGGTIEVAHQKSAQAVRGLVRIQVRGDDKVSSKQLDGIVKGFGLGYLFAPPTAKSKRVNMLMRALWQADHKAAGELSKKDLSKVKPDTVETALKKAGFDDARIAGLHYEEVFDGHFTVVDPQQAEDMAKAGARYLYSTVTKPEHVMLMLTGGQKSSMQRYKEGIIINGMSTNSDFTTGGAVGVFTRLVTLGAIYDGKSWTGRTYKLLQNYKQLARTDWYGWNGDFFGRRWNLATDTNYGTDLIEKIDSKSGYASSNELIFTGGNTPSNVDHVIATTEDARQKLLEHLKEEGYEPHNGMTLEDFVVLSPKFLVHGPSPYSTEDPAAFLKDALEQAKDGKVIPLRWFLTEGPTAGGHRAKAEAAIIAEGEPKMVDALVSSIKTNGNFAMTTKQLDTALGKLLTADDDKAKATITKLTSGAAEALFRSNGNKAAEVLESKKPSTNSYSAYGLDDNAWVRVFEDLITKQPASGRSKAFELALDVRAKYLLDRNHAGFREFLKKHELVSPSQPKSWITKEVKKLADGGESTELALFLAQDITPAQKSWAYKRLIEADNPKALELIKTALKGDHDLGLSADTAKKLLKNLPDNSATKKYLFNTEPDALMKIGDPDIMAMLVDHHKNNAYFGMYDAKRWSSVIDALWDGGEVTPMIRDVMERGSSNLMSDKEFVAKLSAVENLYEIEDPKAFVEEALKELQSGKPGNLKLAWLLGGPEATKPHRVDAIFTLLQKGSYDARSVLDRVRGADPDGKLPIDAKGLHGLLKRFTDENIGQGLDYLCRNAGKQILMAGDPKMVELLDAHLGDEGLGKMSLTGQNLTNMLTELRKKTSAKGKKVAAWALGKAASYAISKNDKHTIDWFGSNDLALSDLGLDEAGAAALVKKSFEQNKYYYENNYGYSGYENLPHGAEWAMKLGGDDLDETMLAAVETALPEWKWTKKLFEGFLKRLPDLSEAWKKKLEKAHKK